MEKNKQASLPQLLNSAPVQARFAEVLGKNPASFVSTLLTIYKDSDALKNCDPKSIIAAAGIAAILKLPILPQLGYSYIIPYGNKAMFQLGYKGLIQLAMRSGLYKNINVTEICEGEIKSQNRITGEIELGERTSEKVVGYVAYMELVNGFSKTIYMTKAAMENHARKYSQSYAYDLKSGKKSSVWSSNFDAMAKKTMLKKMLNTYAPTSIEMQDNALATGLKADQAVVSKNSFEYVDNGGNVVERTDANLTQDNSAETIDIETREVSNANDEVPLPF